MIVTLAGMSAPLDPARREATPEIICAAYARISRSALPVHALREEAARDLAAARSFTERIVRHLGHQSVAEHAVFNVDLLGISRLVTEVIEHSRLASYTERSQRYVRIGEDYVIPHEARELGLSGAFRSLVREQYALYRAATRPEGPTKARVPKEDARYALGLATTTQIGLTANARSLAAMLARLEVDPLHESRLVARRLRRLTARIAPALIPPESAAGAPAGDAQVAQAPPPDWLPGKGSPPALVWHTTEAEQVLRDALAFCGISVGRTGGTLRSLPRAFEAVHLAFHLVMSASAYAQLKRHRMATILAQPYDPDLGLTVPPAMEDAGMAQDLAAVARQSEEMARAVRKANEAAAAYALLNAHRRRVLLIVNARAFGSIAALRLDRHAQWDIRAQVRQMAACLWARLPGVAQAMGLPEITVHD